MGGKLVESVMGAVVLAIAGFFLVFAYTSTDLRPVKGYQLTARFNSVGALAAGADVRIGGVKIGSVVRQHIDPKDYRAVVVFTVRDDIKLPSDTVASVASEGLLGGKYLRLKVGHAKTMLASGGVLKKTRDALALEELLSRAIFLLAEGDGKKTK